jgi:iron complex transport system substrate-binding protein
MRRSFARRAFLSWAYSACISALFSSFALAQVSSSPAARGFAAAPAPKVSAKPARYVSFAPHVTELLFALGVGDSIVGVTEQCDYPPAARDKPRIGTFVHPNLEAVLRAAPTAAFATEGNDRGAVERVRAQGVNVVEVNPLRAAQLATAIRQVAERVGASGRGDELALAVEAGLARLRKGAPSKPRYLIALQFDPLVSVSDDTWLGDVFREAGFLNVVAGSKLRYPVVSEEVLVAARPDVVFLAHEVPRARAEARLRSLLGVAGATKVELVTLPADVFARPGPRIVEAFAFLADFKTRSGATKGPGGK